MRKSVLWTKKNLAGGAQLIHYIHLLEPATKQARELKAEMLREMADGTTGSIARVFLLAEALTLEGKVSYPKLIPPSAAIIAASPETSVGYYRLRIDPKSHKTDKVIAFASTDKGNGAVGPHVRGGIAEYMPVPVDYCIETDCVPKLDSETWVGLYLNAVSLEDAIDVGKVNLTGTQNGVIDLLDMFDKFKPTTNDTIPPLED
jgi:alkyl sulfatase BDS1-like metallo-beta-lactamase superfamily hydrolase